MRAESSSAMPAMCIGLCHAAVVDAPTRFVEGSASAAFPASDGC
jgi:hypothetical protein